MKFDFKLNPFWEIKEKRYCFDIEANGLLKEVNLFFCAVIENVDNGDILYYAPDNADEFLEELSQAKWLIGHNIIGYDLPALKKLYGWQPSESTIIYDTLIAARLYDPDFPMHPDCPKRVPNAHATKAKQDQEREVLTLAGKLSMAEIEMKVSKIEVMKNVGPHTLMNLGYHVGCHKGDFGEEMTFEEYCPEMMVYCAQDVTVNVKIFHMLEKKLRAWSTMSIACEMEVASYISYQMRAGWYFDIDAAGELQGALESLKSEIEDEVRERFKPIPVPHSLDEDKQPAVSFPRVTSSGKLSSVGLKSFFGEGFEELFCIPTFVKTPGSITYTSGHFTKIKWKEFNLGSRPQIAERLQRLGITLTKFTAKGNPIIDDGILNKLHDQHPDVPELLLLKRYFKVNKILSMVNGWMDAYDWDTGRIHGFVNSVGAVTNRMTHSAPNVAQTPSVKTTKIQGAIDPITGFPVYSEKLEGKDLLLICSETSDEYDEGDVVKYSTEFKKILGYAFTKEGVRPQHDFFSGASGKELLWGEQGAWGADCRALFTVPDGYVLVGSDASGLELRCLAHYMNDDHYTDLILNGDIHTYNQKMAGLATRGQSKTFIYAFLYGAGDAKIGQIVGGGAKEGKALKDKFFKGVPKLKRLIDAVANKAEATGMSGVSALRGIDGRRIRIRHMHAALNSLLQSCGAVACKYWLIAIMRQVRAEGLDCTPVGNIHDEVQLQVKEEHVERVCQICIEAMPAVGEMLGFRCPLAAEADAGPNWAFTH